MTAPTKRKPARRQRAIPQKLFVPVLDGYPFHPARARATYAEAKKLKRAMWCMWCESSAVSLAWRDAKIRTYKLMPVKRIGRPPSRQRK